MSTSIEMTGDMKRATVMVHYREPGCDMRCDLELPWPIPQNQTLDVHLESTLIT